MERIRPEELRDFAVALREQGLTLEQIAGDLNISRRSVQRLLSGVPRHTPRSPNAAPAPYARGYANW